jgi:glutaredoxin 3
MAKIEIYTADYCNYCDKAKNLLKSKKIDFNEIELKTEQDRINLVKKTNGRKTVPQIFINNKLIGGFDDLNKLSLENKLDDLLK